MWCQFGTQPALPGGVNAAKFENWKRKRKRKKAALCSPNYKKKKKKKKKLPPQLLKKRDITYSSHRCWLKCPRLFMKLISWQVSISVQKEPVFCRYLILIN
jgi:hypothetical protein